MFYLSTFSLFFLSVSGGSSAEPFIAEVPSLNPNAFSVRFSETTSKQSPVSGLLQTLMALLTSILPKPGEPGGKHLEGPEENAFNVALNTALHEAEGKVSSSLKDATNNNKINSALLLLAEERLKKFWYIGQCRRDYSAPCPLEWVLSAGPPAGLCVPPESYTGPCSSALLSDSTPLAKENFAWRCAVQWRCAAGPPKDLSANCPESWAFIKRGVCTAPLSYRGPCTPFMDFSEYSIEEKLEWAGRCDAPWPAVAAPKAGVSPEAVAAAKISKKPLGGPYKEDGTLVPVFS